MANLTEILKIRVEAELREALEQQAATEGREVSQLVRNTLRAAMVAAGRLEGVIQRG